ncbi:hypothetical protein N7523_000768 [Penicillium sp. IBT 18751x]|nr:hypothetical protein N7523_000768 [Penicillium sp. IBT 18751x]
MPSMIWDGWLEGLSIDRIAKDSSSVSPDQTWAKWIAAAFTMAGGIATEIDLSKPLRGMLRGFTRNLTVLDKAQEGGDRSPLQPHRFPILIFSILL